MYYVIVRKNPNVVCNKVLFYKSKLNKTVGKDNYKIYTKGKIPYEKIYKGMISGHENLFKGNILLEFYSKKSYAKFKLSINRLINPNIENNVIGSVISFKISDMQEYLKNIDFLHKKYLLIYQSKQDLHTIRSYINSYMSGCSMYDEALINKKLIISEYHDSNLENNFKNIQGKLQELKDLFGFYKNEKTSGTNKILQNYNNELAIISREVYQLYENVDHINVDLN